MEGEIEGDFGAVHACLRKENERGHVREHGGHVREPVLFVIVAGPATMTKGQVRELVLWGRRTGHWLWFLFLDNNAKEEGKERMWKF